MHYLWYRPYFESLALRVQSRPLFMELIRVVAQETGDKLVMRVHFMGTWDTKGERMMSLVLLRF